MNKKERQTFLDYAATEGRRARGHETVPDMVDRVLVTLCRNLGDFEDQLLECGRQTFLDESRVSDPIGDTALVTYNTTTDDDGLERCESIEIRNGETVRLNSHRETDEGYEAGSETYTLSNGVLALEASWGSRDCDGRYSGFRNLVATKIVNHRIVWEIEEEEQRDHQAEAAGY